MDNDSWRPIQGGEPAMDTVDWRTQLRPDWWKQLVNKITDTLMKHLPLSGQEGLHVLKKIAERFEEKIYIAATSQSEYLRKVSQKMLTVETTSQNRIPNSMPTNQVGTSNRPPNQDEPELKISPQFTVDNIARIMLSTEAQVDAPPSNPSNAEVINVLNEMREEMREHHRMEEERLSLIEIDLYMRGQRQDMYWAYAHPRDMEYQQLLNMALGTSHQFTRFPQEIYADLMEETHEAPGMPDIPPPPAPKPRTTTTTPHTATNTAKKRKAPMDASTVRRSSHHH